MNDKCMYELLVSFVYPYYIIGNMSREDTVYVGSLSYSASEDDLYGAFEKYGTISEGKSNLFL